MKRVGDIIRINKQNMIFFKDTMVIVYALRQIQDGKIPRNV